MLQGNPTNPHAVTDTPGSVFLGREWRQIQHGLLEVGTCISTCTQARRLAPFAVSSQEAACYSSRRQASLAQGPKGLELVNAQRVRPSVKRLLGGP